MRILVPLDGSDLSESVLPWLQESALRKEADMFLLRVTDPFLVSPGAMPPSMGERMQQQTVVAAEEYLNRVKDRFPGLPLQTITSVGLAREEIAAVAERQHCDLIVMASHGRSGLARWLLGSVAEGVLRVSPCPVLLMRPPVTAATRFGHILVPVDGSSASLAVPHKIAPFLAPGGQVTLLRCSGLDEGDFREPENKAAIDEYLENLRTVLTQVVVDGLDPHIRVLHGDPPECILASAREFGCDLIAMATHGQGGFRHFWVGSVTEKVARQATSPVLVFPASTSR
jgi:nucleotide-binding universal stress UspA family protein